MRIFLTGATGFIGAHAIPVLLAAGHQVIGLTRTDAGARALEAMGVTPHRGALENPASLAEGAAMADAVIHLAFDHDFTNFLENCEKDRRAIRAMGEVMAGSERPLVITSGTGIGATAPGIPAREDVFNTEGANPRKASELAGAEMLEKGVRIVVVRLPQVHDTRRQGFVSPLIMIAREKGVSAYVGDGANRWPAAHVADVAQLYRLAVEQGRAGERFHASDEGAVRMREIATAIGEGMGLPLVSIPPERAVEHFGWLGAFAGLDMPASSEWTRRRLGWRPTGPGLIEDLRAMDYSAV